MDSGFLLLNGFQELLYIDSYHHVLRSHGPALNFTTLWWEWKMMQLLWKWIWQSFSFSFFFPIKVTHTHTHTHTHIYILGFPCGSAGKETACNVGDQSSTPGLGKSPGDGKGYPLQYSGLENSVDCIVHRVAKSWTGLSDFYFHFHFHICIRTFISKHFSREMKNMSTQRPVMNITIILICKMTKILSKPQCPSSGEYINNCSIFI